MAGCLARASGRAEHREDVGEARAEGHHADEGGHDELLLIVGTIAQVMLVAHRLFARVRPGASGPPKSEEERRRCRSEPRLQRSWRDEVTGPIAGKTSSTREGPGILEEPPGRRSSRVA